MNLFSRKVSISWKPLYGVKEHSTDNWEIWVARRGRELCGLKLMLKLSRQWLELNASSRLSDLHAQSDIAPTVTLQVVNITFVFLCILHTSFAVNPEGPLNL